MEGGRVRSRSRARPAGNGLANSSCEIRNVLELIDRPCDKANHCLQLDSGSTPKKSEE